MPSLVQAAVPPTIFRSNSKFDQNLQCSGLKFTPLITFQKHMSSWIWELLNFQHDTCDVPLENSIFDQYLHFDSVHAGNSQHCRLFAVFLLYQETDNRTAAYRAQHSQTRVWIHRCELLAVDLYELILWQFKNGIFQRMNKIFCVEFQKVPFKFLTKYHTHTLKGV